MVKRSLSGVVCYRGNHHSGFLFGSNRNSSRKCCRIRGCWLRNEINIGLSYRSHFFSIAIESHGPLSNKATSFLSDLGRYITTSTSDDRKTSLFFQQISVTLQRLMQ